MKLYALIKNLQNPSLSSKPTTKKKKKKIELLYYTQKTQMPKATINQKKSPTNFPQSIHKPLFSCL